MKKYNTNKIAIRGLKTNKVSAVKGSVKKKDAGKIAKRQKSSVSGYTQSKYHR